VEREKEWALISLYDKDNNDNNNNWSGGGREGSGWRETRKTTGEK
jgi:hypothetical protein